MSDIIAVVSDPYGTTSTDTTVTASQTTVPPNSIENMVDVDLTTLTDGAILIYKNNTAMWTASTLLDAQDMEGGQY